MSVVPLGSQVNVSFSIRSAHGKFLSAQPEGHLTAVANNDAWEKYTIEPVKAGERVFRIKGAHGQFLCVEGETKVMANRKEAAQWESFELVAAPDSNPFDGEFKGALKSKHTNKFLSAQPDGRLEANREKQGEWETFTFKTESNHPFTIKTAHNKFLSAHPNGCLVMADAPNAWEKYSIEPAGSAGVFKIKGAHGQYLCVENDKTVVVNRKEAAQWESFELVPQADTNPFDGELKVGLKSKHTNKFLSAQPDGRLEANRDAPGAWEIFTLQRA
jgi:hypothetical protein